jgi:mRNA-degrading endonuclease toxin of MazEF toxin-antitoxin module
MSKDFDTWNTFKKKLNESTRTIMYKPQTIWWCYLGINIGHEQDGDRLSLERPVLILATFDNETCLCVPITTSINNSPFCQKITLSGKTAYIITSQIRTISIKRLSREDKYPLKNRLQIGTSLYSFNY